MMRIALLCLMIVGFGWVAAGCGTGEISDAQGKAKADAMNDIAKKDPNYKLKQSHGRDANQ